MKAKAANKNDACPLCHSSDWVMSMGSGGVKIYGCLKCRNAQGAHAKVADAKKAWKLYKEAVKRGEA